MAGANHMRTSAVQEEVKGEIDIDWYRPIEPYIPQNVQLIAAHDLIYVATSAGLYAFEYDTGDRAWVYATEMPVGNSPTIDGEDLYLPSYDGRIHHLNAITGQLIGYSPRASSGFSVNPLVLDGIVYAGNRNGYFYAWDPNSTDEWQWQFPAADQEPLGSILFSPAYADGELYFASNDSHAYAITTSGTLKWKSSKLPGSGFHSWWPVIYQDKVILAGSHNYYIGSTMTDNDNAGFNQSEREDIFPPGTADSGDDRFLGTLGTKAGDWASGTTTMDLDKAIDHMEQKPWRRTMFFLNRSDGQEIQFDLDNDGTPEYAPILWAGTRSGNRYPPIVGHDDVLYFKMMTAKRPHVSSGEGHTVGWTTEAPYAAVLGGLGANDEPEAISIGGGVMYRSLCCDRLTSWTEYRNGSNNDKDTIWDYSNPLYQKAPNYDPMWTEIIEGQTNVRLVGLYGNYNGTYHNHGDQNPIIPYKGRLYIHRSNSLLSMTPNSPTATRLPLVLAPTRPTDTIPLRPVSQLQSALETQIQKILDTGHLQPAYINNGQFSFFDDIYRYFESPAHTFWVLSRAIPHIPADMQRGVLDYLQAENINYSPSTIARIGMLEGTQRVPYTIPPEVLAEIPVHLEREELYFEKSTWAGWGTPWENFLPQQNIYALWKYAQVSGEAETILESVRGKALTYVPRGDGYYQDKIYYQHMHIAGLVGYLNLQAMVGEPDDPAVRSELDRLLTLRSDSFSVDSSRQYPISGWTQEKIWSMLNISRNFMWMTPELAEHFRSTIPLKIQGSFDENNYVAPYWFVSRFESTSGEGVVQHLYDPWAMFQAKTMLLQQPYNDIEPYLDAPAFPVGDYFYIHNLISAIEASQGYLAPEITPIPTPATPIPPSITPSTTPLTTPTTSTIPPLDSTLVPHSTTTPLPLQTPTETPTPIHSPVPIPPGRSGSDPVLIPIMKLGNIEITLVLGLLLNEVKP